MTNRLTDYRASRNRLVERSDEQLDRQDVEGLPDVERLLYRVPEAADLLGISRTNVYYLMNEGKIPSVKIGSRRLIRRAALETFVDGLVDVV